MSTLSNELMFGILLILIVISAFFSASETGMMSLNRYRLRHMSKTSKLARRVKTLLDRPDRLLGVILIGNNFANILASSIATIIAVRIMGEVGVLISSMILTLIVLIFAEVSPKTLAAHYPEKVAFPAAYILTALLYLLYPFVLAINGISNGLLRMLKISAPSKRADHLSSEELKTIVDEVAQKIPLAHREMMLQILDLENVTVEDVMVPKSEIIGIDINNEWEAIEGQLANCQHTFLPVFDVDLDQVLGILHLKKAIHLITTNQFNKEQLKASLIESYFVPEGNSLTTQLIHFKESKNRFAMVVDEYGDIQGIITLEDILEEIVGEYTTDMANNSKDIHPQKDGSYVIDGSISIRELNRALDIKLPTKEAKTLSGLLIEHLQTIPEHNTCVLIENIPIEVIQTNENRIKTARLSPELILDETKNN